LSAGARPTFFRVDLFTARTGARLEALLAGTRLALSSAVFSPSRSTSAVTLLTESTRSDLFTNTSGVCESQ